MGKNQIKTVDRKEVTTMARKKAPFVLNKMRHIITNLNPKSPISEQYRTIRTNLQFASVDDALTSLLVTSSGTSEGKSLTTANIAVTYAQQGLRTLLVDADLRKPTVHYTFRLDNIKGLSNVLVGESLLDEAVSTTDVLNLEVMTAGPIPPNPSELLGSRKMREMFQRATQQYDIVIFDTPPVLAVTDAQILADLVDGSILVVRSEQTEYEAAEKAVAALKPARAKLLGTILNDREKGKSNYYYYYGTE